MARAATAWYVYIVRCADSTLYTGVAIDVTRRVAEHNGVRSKRAGARYTRSRRPVKLVYREPAANRSAACKREYRIKQLPRAEKLALIAAGSRMISVAKKKPAADHGQKKSSGKKSNKKNSRKKSVFIVYMGDAKHVWKKSDLLEHKNIWNPETEEGKQGVETHIKQREVGVT